MTQCKTLTFFLYFVNLSFVTYSAAAAHRLFLSFAYPSLILRLSFAYPSLIVRSLFAHCSLIVRSLFALNKLCLVIKKAQDVMS